MSTFEPLPHPFGDHYEHNKNLPNAKPLVELEMTRLSASLRGKPSWWTKFRDPRVSVKWQAEALAQASLMLPHHIDYVLQELDGYANLRDENSGAEVSCYDRIWQSDRLIPTSVREDLVTGVAKLENVPEPEKDWHPRSNGQVLDLVHPSLYPLVYGRTLSYPADSAERDVKDLAARCKPPSWDSRQRLRTEPYYFISDNFQWLPTDFKVSNDAKSVKSLSYINNLDPTENAGLYGTIEQLVASYIPLFERALTDSLPQNEVIPRRTRDAFEDDWHAPGLSLRQFEDREYGKKFMEWRDSLATIPPGLRNLEGYETGSLERRVTKYTLAGRTIQVIVKLANIHLTPDKPEYPGGSWHVEGMKNESIAVSGIYYYDEENITESRLAFRTAVNEPDRMSYEQDDKRGCRFVWGMARDDPCVNELGSVVTSQHRCIAFPNIYQHRVLPFELADKTKPGHRKIVALFLVDPAVSIPSTTIVPPQQEEWRGTAIASNPVLKAALDKLSPELIDRINDLIGGTMTREEAEEYRLELMDERTEFVHENNNQFFNVGFSMCEH